MKLNCVLYTACSVVFVFFEDGRRCTNYYHYVAIMAGAILLWNSELRRALAPQLNQSFKTVNDTSNINALGKPNDFKGT